MPPERLRQVFFADATRPKLTLARNWASPPTLSLFLRREHKMPQDKMKSEDSVPQADKQAHTEMAEREGQQGEQAHLINKDQAEKKKAP
ncbi:MAG: hypothetical protein WA864_10100 [Acetobacteraceae bacterium]|jgi:hypothetical protein